ncbi:hypothetical protein HRbin07_00064 [bacterium HR07]|nr:hypothetical protein HRbin07_00064 [bacterium HR07]
MPRLVRQITRNAHRLGDNLPALRAKLELLELFGAVLNDAKALKLDGLFGFFEFFKAIEAQERPLDGRLRGCMGLKPADARAVGNRRQLREIFGSACSRSADLTNDVCREFFCRPKAN